MQLTCRNKKCQHTWNYTGRRKFNCLCPSCGTRVSFYENTNLPEEDRGYRGPRIQITDGDAIRPLLDMMIDVQATQVRGDEVGE